MTDKFPNLRDGQSFDFDHEGLPCHAIVNRYISGQIGEVFLDLGRVGSTAHRVGKELAVVFSIARRYGAPMDTIKAALPLLADGQPAGPLGLALMEAELRDA